jgi:hypothetical protein
MYKIKGAHSSCLDVKNNIKMNRGIKVNLQAFFSITSVLDAGVTAFSRSGRFTRG